VEKQWGASHHVEQSASELLRLALLFIHVEKVINQRSLLRTITEGIVGAGIFPVCGIPPGGLPVLVDMIKQSSGDCV